MEKLEKLIREAINSTCSENASNTPDFILAEYLVNCLEAFNREVADPQSSSNPLLEGSPRFVEDCRVAYTLAVEKRQRWHKSSILLKYSGDGDIKVTLKK